MKGMPSIGNSEISYEDIIDVEGIDVESTPIHENEGDGVKMDSTSKEENNEGWIKMPSTNEGEIVFPNGVKAKVENEEKEGTKVIEEEELEEKDSKLLATGLKVVGGALIITALITAWNKDKVANWFKDFKSDLNKTNNEDSLNEEPIYDNALAEVGAAIDEEEKQIQEIQEIQEATQSIEGGVVDKVIGEQILAFTDAYDDTQVSTRAQYINTYLQKSNVNDITTEDLCDQTKFINGTYNASTDDEAWDIYNSCLDTFTAYTNNILQNVKFASNMVDENGVHAALGFDAFLVDNSPHSALMEEASTLFINLLTAQTMDEKSDAAKMFIKFENDLMIGLKETPNGTKISYIDLNDSEAFIIGLMFQTGNMTCTAALGDNIEITYTDNIGVEYIVPLQKLREYYYASTCGEQTVWEMASYNLIETAISKGRILTPSN